jgi:hypothetical protein
LLSTTLRFIYLGLGDEINHLPAGIYYIAPMKSTGHRDEEPEVGYHWKKFGSTPPPLHLNASPLRTGKESMKL